MSSEDVFTEPESGHENWVDVRMTDPEKGEWDVDVVVLDGQVEYVDLRIRPELLASFVDCLVEDVDADRAQSIIETVAQKRGIDVETDGFDDAEETSETGEDETQAEAEDETP